MMFKNKKNIEILRKALDVIAIEEAAELPSPEECAYVTFSKEFEDKMEKLIRKQSKPYYYLINTVGKRVACVIIAVLITLTSITFGVKAIREAVINFFIETFEKFSVVSYNEEDIPTETEFLKTYYAPTYIPNGYNLEFNEKLSIFYRIEYVSNDSRLCFNQNTLREVSAYIDTENAQTENITISGFSAIYVVKNDSVSIYWNDNNYSYMVRSEGNLSEDEIVKFAESVKPE